MTQAMPPGSVEAMCLLTHLLSDHFTEEEKSRIQEALQFGWEEVVVMANTNEHVDGSRASIEQLLSKEPDNVGLQCCTDVTRFVLLALLLGGFKFSYESQTGVDSETRIAMLEKNLPISDLKDYTKFSLTVDFAATVAQLNLTTVLDLKRAFFENYFSTHE